jgi:myosin heavy subunit
MNRANALVNIFGELGGMIKDVFSGDFDNIQTRLTNVVKLSADFATGIENSHEVIANKLNAALDESKSKIKEANELEDAGLALTKRKRAFVVREAELLAEIADARRIANDEEQDRATQARAISEAEALTNTLAQERLGIANQELSLMKQEAAMFDSNAETLDAIAQKEREVFEINKAQDDLLRSLSRRKATINNQLDSELKKVTAIRDIQSSGPTEKERTDDFVKESERRVETSDNETSIETENVGKRQATQEDYFGAVADGFTVAKVLAGENAEAQKEVAIAEAIISTIQSAVNSYNSLSGIAVIGPALGAVAAAAAIASGYARVQQIRNTKIPRYFKGTEYLTDSSSPQGRDTIPAFLNKGERIVPTEYNRQLAGISNPELPKLARLGQVMREQGFLQMVKQQQQTNELLGNFVYTDAQGRQWDLKGNMKIYNA